MFSTKVLNRDYVPARSRTREPLPSKNSREEYAMEVFLRSITYYDRGQINLLNAESGEVHYDIRVHAQRTCETPSQGRLTLCPHSKH